MKWERIRDGGWIVGKPGYEATAEDGTIWFIAEDFDDEDVSAKTLWFLHRDGEFNTTHETLGAAKEYAEK